MNPVRTLRRRLGWKLFASYLLVVLVGATVLWTTVQALVPAALSPHFNRMAETLERVEERRRT